MNNKKPNIFIILIYLVFFFRLIKNSFSYLDPDFGLHLRVGQDIWLKKEIPLLNTYNFDFLNVTWVDHEWLFNLFIYLIYNYAGYITLTIIFACFPLVSVSLLMKLTNTIQITQLNNSEKIELYSYFYFLAFLGCYASLPIFGIRMQEVTIIFIPILLICLYRFEDRISQNSLYVLPILFYFWANLHGSFLIGFFILAVWFILKLVISLFPVNYGGKDYFDFGRLYNKRDYIKYIVWSILSFAITLITPYGIALYGFLYTYTNTYYMIHIYEWLPFYYSPININQIYYTLLYLIILFVYFNSVHKNPRKTAKTSLMLFALSIIFLCLSLKSKRHFTLFVATSLPLMASWLLIILEINKTKYRYIFSDVIIRNCLLILLLVLSAYFFIPSRITSDPFNSYCNQYPCKALEHLKSNGKYLEKNIFNMYQWGGYLNWMWQEKNIFIDGRIPQAIVYNHTLLEEYHEFFDKERISIKLDQYNIDVVLLSKDFIPELYWYEKAFANVNALENDKFREMYNYLKTDQNWANEYEDSISVIYVRKSGN
jgi:hypothetical protein